MTHLPLAGKTALVTGVSRRRGIGFAVASRLLSDGASVFIQHHRANDVAQPWGGDDIDALVAELRALAGPDALVGEAGADLRSPTAPEALVAQAAALNGGLDILVCNQAKSGDDGSIHDMTAERLGAMWETNTRATLLMTAAFAALHGGRPGGARPGDRADGAPLEAPTGRVIWMTSGQGDGPMRGEVAYAASKAALSGVTATVAAELLEPRSHPQHDQPRSREHRISRLRLHRPRPRAHRRVAPADPVWPVRRPRRPREPHRLAGVRAGRMGGGSGPEVRRRAQPVLICTDLSASGHPQRPLGRSGVRDRALSDHWGARMGDWGAGVTGARVTVALG
ncbi:SDR family NAD(P)-dependent oxidoreductase [Demequina litorisediminis]|uniref:3-oxoacyl-[acyl-carrier protein] reductase n=1 Tax=Demequina litorisediminis TaxID=1849022 RepID=A0ABQ6IIH4_9MICO|nr:hypothetical protein GCM10025876_33950 [Demequina litorisediminis]